MKTVYSTMLFAIVLIAGCQASRNDDSVQALETAIISCEAAHITIETIPLVLEETDGND